MSMYINTNVGAINAHRNLGMNNTAMGKTMEKLSSGYRINRAADDAAGLAISEKMRFQINGLNQAMRNAQDGISLLQTAEGALTEVHSMLQRMNTLANQASNGTYQKEDRNKLQAEVKQLVAEINNITNSTKFNGVDLLKTDGTNDTIKFQVGVNAENVIDIKLADMSASSLKLSDEQAAAAKSKINEGALADLGVKFNGTNFVDRDGNDVKVSYDKGGTDTPITDLATLNGLAADTVVTVKAADDSDIGTIKAAADITNTDISKIDITDEQGARAAIAVIENAINLVSEQRSAFGAVQNRLEHTINNLGVNAENLSASESRIRNADMAKEMTEFTRNQILVQAGTAMLAQANSAPQSVLKLLG